MLETIYYISQIVAVTLVLASLIFVGVEIRQNTEQSSQSNIIARADLSERLLAKFNNTWAILATDDVVSHAFEKIFLGGDDLEPNEHLRLTIWFSNLLNGHFNAFLLLEDGLFDAKMINAFDNNTRWLLSFNFFEQEWQRLLDQNLNFSSGFVKRIEALTSTAPEKQETAREKSEIDESGTSA